MTAWTIVGALMLISVVTATIFSVVRLDDHFRDEQQGHPVGPHDRAPRF